jgi:hypothetical protein
MALFLMPGHGPRAADPGGAYFFGRCSAIRFGIWHRTAHIGSRLVPAQPFIDDLAQKVVFRPGQEFDLGDQLGPHPNGRG